MQDVNLGTGPNTPGSDSRYTAFLKIKQNIAELFGAGSAPAIVRPPIRPENFNAKFDGSTDDTAAWAATIAAATARGACEIRMPSGVSIVQAGTIALPNKVQLIGQGRWGTTIKRKEGSVGVLLDQSGTSDDAGRYFGGLLANFGLHGDDVYTSGLLLRQAYMSECLVDNVRLFNSLSAGMLVIACWDSQWRSMLLDWCGIGGTASTQTTVGCEALVISAATAASGFGASGDGAAGGGNNNLTFRDIRTESFSLGLAILDQYCQHAHGNSQIRFDGCKWESVRLGSNSGADGNYIGYVDPDAKHVWFSRCYFAAHPVLANAGTFDLLKLHGYSGLVVRDTQVYLGHATHFRSVINSAVPSARAGTCRVEQMVVDGNAPATAVIWNSNSPTSGNIPYFGVSYGDGQSGTITSPVYAAT